MSSKQKYLVIIAGPTAVGKTSLSIELARHFETEILSADSRQIYKELNIGTAKPNENELAAVPHHMINHISIKNSYSVGQYERDALLVINQIFQRTNILIVSGGTGLYLNALLNGLDEFPEVPPEIVDNLNQQFEADGLKPLKELLVAVDPEYYERVDLDNARRIIRALSIYQVSGRPYSSFLSATKAKRPFSPIMIVLSRDRQELYDRINIRVDQMMDAGLLDEVKSLVDYQSLQSLQTVGYQELFSFLEGEFSLDMAIELIKRNSRRYAKRQMTWFRNQLDAKEFGADDRNGVISFIEDLIEENG